MIPEKVSRVLQAHNLKAIEFEPGSTATSALAAAQLGVSVGQIAKSLLFLGKDGRYFMLCCPGDRKASSSKIKTAIGVKTRMARHEETLGATGFEPGGVCPFGIDGDIRVLIRQLDGSLDVPLDKLSDARLCQALTLRSSSSASSHSW